MARIEAVPRTRPMLVIEVDMETETVRFDFLNAETAARASLLLMGLEMAKAKLLADSDDTGRPAS